MNAATSVLIGLLISLSILAAAYFLFFKPKCTPPAKTKGLFECDCSGPNTNGSTKNCECASGYILKDGQCKPCGQLGGNCCPGSACADENKTTCQDDTCQSCGDAVGSHCCDHGTIKCPGAPETSMCDTTTHKCVVCGSQHQQCCYNESGKLCTGTLTCSDDTCE